MNSEGLIIIVIVGALVLTIISAVLIVGLLYWWFKNEQSKKQHVEPKQTGKALSTDANTTSVASNKENFSAFAPPKEEPVINKAFPLQNPPPPQLFSKDELIDMEPPPLSDPNTEDGIYNEQESPTEENIEQSTTTTINEGEEETLGENDATVLMMRPPPKGIKLKKPIVKK